MFAQYGEGTPYKNGVYRKVGGQIKLPEGKPMVA